MTTAFNEFNHEQNRQFADQLIGRITAIRTQYQCIAENDWDTATVELLHRLIDSLPELANSFGMQHSLSDASRSLENRLSILIQNKLPPSMEEWRIIGVELDQLEQLTWICLESAADAQQTSALMSQPARSPLIHLVGNDQTAAKNLEHALRNDGFRTQAFANPAEFRAAFAPPGAEAPAAIILDMMLSTSEALGLGDIQETPVIVTSVRDDIPARLAAFRAGACRYLVKPVDPARLIDILEAITGRQPQQPYRVLLVDDDTLMLEIHAAMLESAGIEVRKLSQPLQMLDVLEDFSPDVAIFDVYMPEASGPEMAAILRERDAYLNLSIVYLSGETDISEQLLALNIGGDDFLVKPVELKHLLAVVTARARRARQNSSLRRRLETTLYELEREHLAINQHALVSITDQSGVITYVNEQFCKISGYTRNELLGQNHSIIKSHKHPPEFYQALWQTLLKGLVWQGEICNQSKSGVLYWVESTITPFVDETGKPYQFISIHTNISHVKEVEAALQLSEERYQLAVTATQDGMWDWNMTTGRVYYSPRWEKMFGFETGSFQQSLEAFAPLVHPDDVVSMFEEVQRYLRREIPTYSREFRMIRRDGVQLWTLHQAVGIFDPKGKPLRLVGTTTDITARKTAEVALRATLDSTQDGILAIDQNGYISFSNRLFAEMWRIPEILLTGRQLDQGLLDHIQNLLINPAIFLNKVQDMHLSDQDTQDILEFNDGRIFESHSKPLLLDKNNQTGRVWSFREITKNKRAELALAESESQLRHAQEVARLGSFNWKPLSGELHWSDEHFRLWGLEPGASKPDYTLFRQGIHPDDAEQVERALQQAFTGQRSYDCVHRVIWPDGDERYIRGMGEVMFDPNGQAIRMIGTVQDVTEQIRVERALMTARDDAEQANQAKSEFLANMSHELRTPMNAILGFGQLLEYDKTLTTTQQEDVRAILKAGHHLLELINEVLDLAKVESGNIDLSLEPVQLEPIIEECLGLISTLAEKRSIQMHHTELAGIVVRADRTRIKQVLLNLLSNAVKYNNEGGSVIINTQSTGSDSIKILVTDTGPGIPAKRLNELFQPFNRLEAEYTSIEGTGIGLTITRRIVELMGGKIDVHTEVGVGCTFWIELPLESTPSQTQDHSATFANAEAMPDSNTPHTVLYIEDNPVNIKLMAQILGRRKHIRLLTAHTPELGIELALINEPDLILLDINLPCMNGYQILEIFKNSPLLMYTPVIAITADAMQRDIQRGKAAGFDDYLTKPIDIPSLFGIVDTMMKTNKTSTRVRP